jgi:hypothetical protein
LRALHIIGAAKKLRNYSNNSRGGFSVKKHLAKISVFLGVILYAAAGMASAQDVSKGPVIVTSMKPPVRVAIHAGKLLDPLTGNYSTNVFILGEDGRI